MLTGSESHLYPNIMNSEILPENYTAASNDPNDWYGEVIVVYKKTWWLKKTSLNSLEVVLYLLKLKRLKNHSWFVLVNDQQVIIMLQMTISVVTC